jgi:hypothetical protein
MAADAPPRQRTRRATLDWSFDLLEPEDQHAFTALGAFAGGCELAAAEAVTGAGLDVLEGLVAKDNFAVALECAFAGGRAIDALALAGALGPVGWLTNASEWTPGRALARWPPPATTPLRRCAPARCSRWVTAAPNGSRTSSASPRRSPCLRIWRRDQRRPHPHVPQQRNERSRRVEQRFIAPARARLGSGRWEAASTGARSLSADSAIALALEPALLPG